MKIPATRRPGPITANGFANETLRDGENARDVGDGNGPDSLVSETRRDAEDVGDARRMAHNPEVEDSNPSSLPKMQVRRPSSNKEKVFCVWFVN
jgi:hypothetical protein